MPLNTMNIVHYLGTICLILNAYWVIRHTAVYVDYGEQSFLCVYYKAQQYEYLDADWF